VRHHHTHLSLGNSKTFYKAFPTTTIIIIITTTTTTTIKGMSRWADITTDEEDYVDPDPRSLNTNSNHEEDDDDSSLLRLQPEQVEFQIKVPLLKKTRRVLRKVFWGLYRRFV
jgi:hypothetical protein